MSSYTSVPHVITDIVMEIELDGYERYFTWFPGSSTKIAHVMTVNGPVHLIGERGPEALRRVINANPRMRARQSESNRMKAIVGQFISREEAQKLFVVLDSSVDWKNHIQKETNLAFDRFNQLPFKLHFLVENKNQAKLILFSDHFMSDGYSGLIVLDAFLQQISRPLELKENPLRPSIYSRQKTKGVWGLLDKVALKLGNSVIMNEIKGFVPLLPPRDEMHDFDPKNPKFNPTFMYFAQGTAENMKKALSRCKEEKVTLHGAVIVAVALAFAIQKHGKNILDQERINIGIDVDYNMRPRIKPPYEEQPVGFNVGIGTLYNIAKGGLSVKGKFWEAARIAKKETDAYLNEYPLSQRIVLDFLHQRLCYTGGLSSFPNKKSMFNDLNFSNIGKYPFKTTHEFESGDRLEIERVHVVNSYPHLGPSSIVFLSSVKEINYSMASKMDDQTSKNLLDLVVKIIESIGDIGADKTLSDVALQVL